MSKARSIVRRVLVRDRIRSALDSMGWSVAEDAEETIKTPFEKCRAKDPLSCKWHGLMALNKMVEEKLGLPKGSYITGLKETDGEYLLSATASLNAVKAALGGTLSGLGYELTDTKEYLGGSSMIKFAKKKSPSDKIDELSPDESLEDQLEGLDKYLEENMTDEDEATLSEMEALLEEDAEAGLSEEDQQTLAEMGDVLAEVEGGGQGETDDANKIHEQVVNDALLPPLVHDETKFPQGIAQDELDKLIAGGKSLGGASGDDATMITLSDGRRFVCKSGTGEHAEHIHNEVLADQAYRAGGIMAPDCKEYEFGDGDAKKTYKLSEFIEGKSLHDFMANATEEQKDAIRSELLKGFPLDVLFSNWDVIGTSRDNVIVDKDGNAWRVDNGGSFEMAAMSNKKTMAWAVENYIKNPEEDKKPPLAAFENWDEEGGWAKRQWIDDFRTMRIDAKNKGLFDGYSTADIFMSAGNIDLGNAVASLPDHLQKALAKPLFEMKQMAMRTISADLAGYGNNEALSTALDATYEASKQGFRELCNSEISFDGGGIGAKVSDKGEDPVYPKPKPLPPKSPEEKFAASQKMPNSAYTGTQIGTVILNAAKSINYHAGVKTDDAEGNVIGSGNVMSPPDFKPNQSKIDAFMKIDRGKLVKLAETDESAKKALACYDAVADAVDNGFKAPIKVVNGIDIKAQLPAGFKTDEEKEFDEHKAEVMAQFKKELDNYNNVTLPNYNHDKDEWIAAEKAKIASGEHVLTGNFYDIANEFMEAAYGTNGIARHNGEGIGFIELGKHQNKYGGEIVGSATHNDSWTPAASRLKVLDLLMRGMKIEDIIAIKDDDPFINNGHWSDKKAKDWFLGQARELRDNPEQMRRELASYAVFKGLQTVKLENQSAPKEAGGKKVDWIDPRSHTVGLIRKETYDNAKVGTIGKVEQKGANTSCGFQDNGSIGTYPYVYQVPLWNVAFTYSDHNHNGSEHSDHFADEHEWCATLIGLTPFRVDGSTDASLNIDKARSNKTIKEEMDNRKSRLAPFFTTLAELEKIKDAS